MTGSILSLMWRNRQLLVVGWHLVGLFDFIGKPISLQADAVGLPKDCDIALLQKFPSWADL